MPAGHDIFTLYDFRVEVAATDRPMACNRRPGEVTVVSLGKG